MKKNFYFLALALALLSANVLKSQSYVLSPPGGSVFTTCRGFVQNDLCCYDWPFCTQVYYCQGDDHWNTFQSGTPGMPIKINFTFFDLNTGDFVRVYQGTGTGGPLLATFTNTYTTLGSAVTSTTGVITIRFTTNTDNAVGQGYNAIIGCPPVGCAGNQPASDNCAGATRICDASPYCGNTGGWYTADNENIAAINAEANNFPNTFTTNGTFCGSIENNSWIVFTANQPLPTFSVSVGNCASGSSGIQMLLLNSSNCNTFSAVSSCISQSTAPSSFTIGAATPLTPGTDYYIMVDGYAGNYCDYTVTPTSGVQIATLNPTPASLCQGQTAAMTTSNAVIGSTYSWTASQPGSFSGSPTASSVIATPTLVGSTIYTVSITQPNGCTVQTYTRSITLNARPTANAGTPPSSVTCANPTRTLSGSGGGTYAWSGPGIVSGSNTANPVVNQGGTYTLVVTSGAGCTSTNVATVAVPINTNTPGASATVASSLNCTTLTTQITVSTSASPVSYNTTGPGVTAGGATSLVTVNTGGTYNYSVTNTTNGCVSAGNISVTQNTSTANVTAVPSNSLNCIINTATITINSSSAAVTYTTNGPGVTGGSTSSLVSVNSGGTYNYTVTNTFNTCKTTGSVAVIQNTAAVTATATPASSLNCTTLSTQITINSSTSTATYTTNGPGVTGGSTSSVVTVNTGGVYNYTVTNPLNSCTASGTVSVGQNTTAPTASITVPGVLNCTNTAMPVSGSPTSGVTYNWTGPSGFTSTNANPTVTLPGSYNLTVTSSANNCTNSAGAIVSQNNTVSATANTSGSITCVTNTISLSAVPSGMNYTWTPPGGGSIVSGQGSASAVGQGLGTYSLLLYNPTNACTATAVVAANVNTTQAAPNAVSSGTVNCATTTVNLSSTTSGVTYTWVAPGGSSVTAPNSSVSAANGSGVYTLNITNNTNGCTATNTVSPVTQTVNPTPSISNSPTITCSGSTVTINGAPISGVTYTWSTTGGNIVGSPNNQAANVNSAGVYSLAVTSTSNGCTSTGFATVNIGSNTITPNITIGSNATLPCNPATVQITSTVSPGTATLVWTGPNVQSGANSSVAVAGASGVYTLTATNPSNGCAETATLNVSPAAGLTVTATQPGTITCATTTVEVAVTASPSTVSYSWTGSGITGGNGTATITVNQGGTYSVLVTNTVNGCTQNLTNAVTADNAAINPNTSVTNSVDCATSSATINTAPTPTTGTYNYLWAGPAVTGATTSAVAVSPTSTTIYTVTVLNPANSCTATQIVTVTANTNPPTSVSVSPNSVTLTCNPPPTVLSASATGASSYSWTASGPGIITATSVSNATVQGSGTYSLYAIGANGCVSAAEVVTVTPDDATPTFSLSNPSPSITCSGPPTVSVTITSTVPISSYSWSPGTNTTNVGTFTTAGSYTCLITANNGCTTSAIVNVNTNTTSPVLVSGTGTAQALSCTNSVVTIDPVFTPSANLTYTWSGPGIVGSSSGSSVQVNQSGNYSVTVVDAVNGCSATTLVVPVTGNNVAPTVSVSSSSSIGISCSPATSTVTLNAVSGSTNATFSWVGPNGFSSAIASPSVNEAGSYTVTITDPSSGCSSSGTISVQSNTVAPDFTATAVGELPCGGGSTNLNATSSSSNVTYNWTGPNSFSSAVANPAVNEPGTYSITVTDNLTGCETSTVVTISQTTVSALAASDVTTGPAPLAVNFNNLSSGATSFSWTLGDGNTSSLNNPSNTYSQAGTYTVVLYAVNGSCDGTDTLIIKVLESLGAIPEIFTPNGDGKNDVFEITGIDSYPRNSLNVFNRWGNLVYKAEPYKNDWDATPNASGKTGSGKLPAGTYFYILNLGDEDNTVLRGFIQIQY